MNLSSSELQLVLRIAGDTLKSVERRSDREYDLGIVYDDPEYGWECRGWLPLAAIAHFVAWTDKAVAQMTDYPEMVVAGDWSGIRDSSRESIWAIFERFVP